MDGMDFLESVRGYVGPDNAEPSIKFATVDPSYVSGSPKVTFDGESSLTTKEYICVSGYTPAAGDRVVLLKAGATYVILGSIATNPSSVMPSGSILIFGGTAAPSGFLMCDGSAVSRTTFADLFGIIGTAYGAGDGSTTFNLPDMTSKFPRGGSPGTGGGADTHTHTSAAHSHTLSDPNSYAKIITTGTHVYNTRSSLGNRQTSGEFDYSVSTATTGSVSVSVGGTQLGGATDSTAPGNTGSASNVPAYTNVNYIIKT